MDQSLMRMHWTCRYINFNKPITKVMTPPIQRSSYATESATTTRRGVCNSLYWPVMRPHQPLVQPALMQQVLRLKLLQNTPHSRGNLAHDESKYWPHPNGRCLENKTRLNTVHRVWKNFYGWVMDVHASVLLPGFAYLAIYPGYFQEPHWFSMGLPEISRVTWQVWFCYQLRVKLLKTAAFHDPTHKKC